jgi:hypothetical protein
MRFGLSSPISPNQPDADMPIDLIALILFVVLPIAISWWAFTKGTR